MPLTKKNQFTRSNAKASLKKLFAKLPKSRRSRMSRKKHKNTESHTTSLHKKKQKLEKLLEKHNITVSKSLLQKYKHLLSVMSLIAVVALAKREEQMAATGEAKHQKTMAGLEARLEYRRLMRDLATSRPYMAVYYLKRLLPFVKLSKDKYKIQQIIDLNPYKIYIASIDDRDYIHIGINESDVLKIYFKEVEKDSQSRIELVIISCERYHEPPRYTPPPPPPRYTSPPPPPRYTPPPPSPPPPSPLDTAFKVLGLESSASYNEAKKQFRRLALKYHPDKTGGNKEDEEKFKTINEAWQIVCEHLPASS